MTHHTRVAAAETLTGENLVDLRREHLGVCCKELRNSLRPRGGKHTARRGRNPDVGRAASADPLADRCGVIAEESGRVFDRHALCSQSNNLLVFVFRHHQAATTPGWHSAVRSQGARREEGCCARAEQDFVLACFPRRLPAALSIFGARGSREDRPLYGATSFPDEGDAWTLAGGTSRATRISLIICVTFMIPAKNRVEFRTLCQLFDVRQLARHSGPRWPETSRCPNVEGDHVPRNSNRGMVETQDGRSRSVKSESDVALVIAITRGHRDALAEMYERHGPRAFGLALHLCGDKLAREIVQQVFLEIWTEPQLYNPEQGSLETFLLTQIHRRSVDRLRSGGVRRTRETAVVESEATALAPTVGDKVRGLLSTLPQGQCDAIILAYFRGHTYRDVADLLGEPEATIKTRIRTGLARLRLALCDEEHQSAESFI